LVLEYCVLPIQRLRLPAMLRASAARAEEVLRTLRPPSPEVEQIREELLKLADTKSGMLNMPCLGQQAAVVR